MKALLFLLALLSSAGLVACSWFEGDNLRTRPLGDKNILKGSYDLILYGGRHEDDIERLALLDSVDSSYRIEPFSSELDFIRIENIDGQKALAQAMSFSRSHHSFQSHRVSEIIDTLGQVVGYEIRPLYDKLRFGTPDVMQINYLRKEKTVSVRITLKSEVEKMLEGD